MKRNWKPILIVALIAAAVYYLLPSLNFYGLTDAERTAMDLDAPEQLVDLHKRSLNLGLDLQGGIHLVLEVKIEGLEPQAAVLARRARARPRERTVFIGGPTSCRPRRGC